MAKPTPRTDSMWERRGDERLVTPEEVAERLGIAAETARQWMRRGDIPGVLKIGGRGLLRIRESDFAAYLRDLPTAQDVP
jgi:excisionase family DNA binding protein